MNRRTLASIAIFSMCACSSPTGTNSGAHLVNKAELPARKREVLEQYERNGPDWLRERAAIQQDPELARFMVENLAVALVRTYERVGPAQSGQKVGPFDRAQAELVFFQAESIPVLVQMLTLKDGIVSFLAADTLKQIGVSALEPVAVVLDATSPEVRRRAAKLLGEMPNGGDGEPALLEKLGNRVAHDDSWTVRAEAAEALGARAARNKERGYAVAVLAKALGDPDAAVAQSAATALEQAGDRRAIPILIKALEQASRQGEPKSARGIAEALKKLSGESRDREVSEWWTWWEQHQSAPKSEPR